MPGRNAGSTKSKKPVDQVTELRDLVVGYAKQETIDPLKSLKRFLILGVSGALCLGVGSVYLILGLLRGLQDLEWFNSSTQTDGWHGACISAGSAVSEHGSSRIVGTRSDCIDLERQPDGDVGAE